MNKQKQIAVVSISSGPNVAKISGVFAERHLHLKVLLFKAFLRRVDELHQINKWVANFTPFTSERPVS